MSTEYREEIKKHTEERIDALLISCPGFLKDFAEYIKGKSREPKTRFSYIDDVLVFLRYEKSSVPFLAQVDIELFPLMVLDNLSVHDIEEYREYLKRSRFLNENSIKRRLSSLSLFFKFLSSRDYIKKNPMETFDSPKLNRKRIIKLESDESNALLSGILRNDKYLDSYYVLNGEKYKTLPYLCRENGISYDEACEYADINKTTIISAIDALSKKNISEESSIIDIPVSVKLAREPQVLRNYAIIRLFLSAGLRVSELVGLDLEDINWKRGSVRIIAKGGDEHEVFFGTAAQDALKQYLSGIPEDFSALDKYPDKKELIHIARNAESVSELESLLSEENANYSPALLNDLINIFIGIRRTGRNGFNPKRNCNAVFISKRGTRMSVPLVEKMVKEMVKTYLPDYQDKNIFTPHKLRATCATRILTQTGDIALASEQLGHKDVTVTSRFYAQLKKEQQKEKIQKLDEDNW